MKLRLLLLPLAFLAAACSELPSPPGATVRSGVFRDTVRFQMFVNEVPVDTFRVDLRDSLRGLIQDASGIWRDYLTSTFTDSSGTWRYGFPFADIPPGYRQFYRYCSNCHSDLGKSFRAGEAREALRLNTWDDILDYGPGRLILAARGGGMPIPPSPAVPEDVLGRAQAYLSSWVDTSQSVILVGYNWKDAEQFVRKYCSDCHTPGGRNRQQTQAMLYLTLDTYDQWHRHEKRISERIDPTTDSSVIMPPDSVGAARQPSEAERNKFMEWIGRFSPNTPDGSGKGDSIRIGNIMTEGAVKGLVFDSAFQLINRYCADCHTEGGLNKDQPDAWLFTLRLDSYQDWKDYPGQYFQERLDPVIAAGIPTTTMPPEYFPNQPTAAEREVLLAWIRRGSPNTPSGR